MSKYKINIDKPLPDDKVINRHKSFESLFDQYQETTKLSIWQKLRKYPVRFASLVALVLVAFLVFESVREEEEMTAKRYVNPPLPDLNVTYQSFPVKASEPVSLESSNGSKIHIPANVYLDGEGNVVKGDIVIKYREFHDPMEVFFAGIPMRYDSAGASYHFESAGMIELMAFQNEKPLFLKKGEQIEISLISGKKDIDFNVYYLDTLKKNWDYRGKDEVIAIPVIKEVDSEQPRTDKPLPPDLDNIYVEDDSIGVAKASGIIPQKPVQPTKVASAKKPFGIEIDNLNRDFPEMKVYQNVYWEHIGDDSTDPWKNKVFDEEWHSVEIRRAGTTAVSRVQSDRFEIIFTKGSKIFKLIARPAFQNQDYEKAMERYNRQLAAYTQAKEAKEIKLAKIEAAKAKAMREYNEKLKAWEESNTLNTTTREVADEVIRKFMVDQFGIWNCDRFLHEKGSQQTIVMMNEKGKNISQGNKLFAPPVYVVDWENKRMMAAESIGNGVAELPLLDGANNMLWTVTADGKVAILKPKAFNEQLSNAQAEKHDIRLETLQQEFANIEELKAFLSL